ncbi:MAG: alkaline phosphatase family protein [Saprospiraceae bacterium]|nr:alkaline phosphatase family protein [Saprospiraceae bacterium]
MLFAALAAFPCSAPAQKAIPTPMEWGRSQRSGAVIRLAESAIRRYFPLAQALEDRALESSGTLAKNLIVVTADGLRWQEVFEGIPVSSPLCKPEDGRDAGQALPRETLMPFFWNTLARHGQVYGNRRYGSEVSVANRMRISYPGYSEIICGFPDDKRIILNSKKQNPNRHVFEWLNKQRGYRGRVAAFGSWELFSWIFNEERAEIPVNAGFEKIRTRGGLSAGQYRLNALLDSSPRPWHDHVRPDTLTWAFAKEYLERRRPRVLFVGFGETDEYAHEGNAAGYVQAIARFDSLLAEIWRFIESHEHYRGKTALLITTDHGRGRHNWRMHHPLAPGSEETWFAVASPDLEARGEVRESGQIRHEQFARTMLRLIGQHHEASDARMAPEPEVVFEKENTLFAAPRMDGGSFPAPEVPVTPGGRGPER